jgi:hypothetical protein
MPSSPSTGDNNRRREAPKIPGWCQSFSEGSKRVHLAGFGDANQIFTGIPVVWRIAGKTGLMIVRAS